ncbi:MAG: hypothetical protein V3T59_06565 [Desulfobacterales bacterium]
MPCLKFDVFNQDKSTGIDNPENNFCKACFGGCYPVKFDESISKDCLERI